MLRTGIDLVEINRLENLRPEIRERFLQRVFTPGELQDAHGSLQMLSGGLLPRRLLPRHYRPALVPSVGRILKSAKALQANPY